MMIRQATLADLPAIMRIEVASFPSDAWPEDVMRAELQSAHNFYVVYEQAGSVNGYAGLRAVAGSGDVQTIALDESSRGAGRGRELLNTLIEQALLRGVHEIFLEVRDDNLPAQRLYLTEGFVEIGRRPRYYQPDDVDAVIMRLDLSARANAARETLANEEGSG